MTGPPYPRFPAGAGPGQNALGSFVIGVSPIGDIPPFDPLKTIISQYANSPIIDSLITSLAAAMDRTADFDNFFDTIWNVATAVGYGLDLWGRIVGVSRVLQLPNPAVFLGFQQANSWVGFGQGPLYSGAALTTSVALSDAAFRLLILAKAAANIWDGSIPQLNKILLSLFPGRGNCYVVDNLNLSLIYQFAFLLTQVEFAIVTSGVLPRTSGVQFSIVQGAPH